MENFIFCAGNIAWHHANPVCIIKRRKWLFSRENKIAINCYILKKPQIKGYRMRLLNLWLIYIFNKNNDVRKEVKDAAAALETNKEIESFRGEDVQIIEQLVTVQEDDTIL